MAFNLFKTSERKRLETENADRIPPGQSLTTGFPVLHYGPVPRVDLAKWNFKVSGQVENPLALNWQELKALPSKRVKVDIHCVTRWTKLDTEWEGVDMLALLERVKPTRNAHFAVASCEYGFTTSVPLEVLKDPDVLLAYNYDGKPLDPEHGYPLRLLVPKRYFWKSAKWIRGLSFLEEDQLGFWERHGYHNNADYWKEERFSDD
jgi:DMSO/TMAO reductase YedYZ molybdopterin-dependent catalytic subunit